MANTKSCSSVLAAGTCGGIIGSQTALSEPTPPIQPPAIQAVPSLAEIQSVFVAFSLWTSYGPSTRNIL